MTLKMTGTTLDTSRIEAVFQSRPDIIAGIKTNADSPGRITLFNEIAGHVLNQQRSNEEDEPAQKKRRLEAAAQAQSNADAGAAGAGAVADGQTSAAAAADETVLLEIKEISVAVPQRKKLELCFTANHLYARAPGTTAPIPSISYAWKDIEYAFFLPVPDKAQAQHNYVLFPRGTCLPSKANPATPSIEPLVFTVPTTAPKQGTIGGSEANAASSTVTASYQALIHWAFGQRFASVGSPVRIVSGERSNFQSVVRQQSRPNEKAVHVNGFRGSKDGHLFFLENGLLWGFKKPLIFIPTDRIAAVSFTSILTVTFNMVVEAFVGEGNASEELEFGMLDQQDFQGIENYVRLNRLQDRSMAEQRKAKLQLAENRGPKKRQDQGDGEPGADGDAMAIDDQPNDGLTELERAEREAEQRLQDEEDEEEEDYVPESDGDSDGSGSSSEEESDDDGGETEEEEDDGEEGEGEKKGEDEEQSGKVKDEKHGEETRTVKVKEEAKEAKAPAARVKPPPRTRAKRQEPQIPVRPGWASFNAPVASNDIDMDEKFDVVG